MAFFKMLLNTLANLFRVSVQHDRLANIILNAFSTRIQLRIQFICNLYHHIIQVIFVF